VHPVAAVAGFEDEIAFASRADRLFARQPVAAFRFADDGVALRTAVDGNALHAVHLDVVDAHDAGRQVVVGADDAFAHDVVEPLGRGVAQFEMQMGTQRRTAVARKSDRVALCDGPCAGAEPEIDAVRAAAEAFVADVFFDVAAEPLQVAVYGRRAVAEREVYRPSVARRADAHARDVTVGHGHEGFALAAVGLDVYAAVEVSGTHFAEVGRVKPRDAADRIYVISGVEPLALRPGADRREKQ